MRYLKYFESNNWYFEIDENTFSNISFESYIKFSDKDIQSINDFFKFTKSNYWASNYRFYSIYINSYTSFNIKKTNDDWFIVNPNLHNPNRAIYKCDEIEGLLKLLKYIII